MTFIAPRSDLTLEASEKTTPRHPLRTLNEAFRGFRRSVAFLAGLSVVSAVLDAIGINALIPLVSFVTGDGASTDFVSRSLVGVFEFLGVPFSFRYLLAFTVMIFLARAVALAFFTYVRSRTSARFLAREVNALFSAMMRAPWSFVLSRKAATLQNTIFWDARRETQLLDGVIQFVQSSTGALMYLLVAINISAPITVVTLVTGGVLLVASRPLLKRTRSYGNAAATTEKQLAQHVSESIQGFKQAKAAGAGAAIAHIGARSVAQLEHILSRAMFVQNLGAIFIQPLSFIFLIFIFVFSYLTGTFNIAAFAATVYLIQKIFTYTDSMLTSFHTIVQFIPFAENIARFKRALAETHEPSEEKGAPFAFRDRITFKNVSFEYETERGGLKDVSFEIPKGSFIGIVGPSGSGKTTIADLVLRLFSPTAGAILIDGKHADEVATGSWRHAIAYVSQDVFLLNASIVDNIRFFDTTVTKQDIEAAAKGAQLYDDIMRLPEGFDTMVGDRGVLFSGGQRQRIALARALARKPDILVLDEMTSALDSGLEAEIQKTIRGFRGDVTLVMIAHRISTVADADQVIVLEDGKVIEKGDPAEMLRNSDSYLARMLRLQKGEV